MTNTKQRQTIKKSNQANKRGQQLLWQRLQNEIVTQNAIKSAKKNNNKKKRQAIQLQENKNKGAQWKQFGKRRQLNAINEIVQLSE